MMESASNGPVQSEDNEGSQASPTCLRIPQILSTILSHCSSSELLQLTLVNKQWNYEARRVMRDRGTTNARLDLNQTCQAISAFASNLRQMNVVPYSGIIVYFKHLGPEQDCWSDALLDSSIDEILNRVPLRHFAIISNGSWKMFSGCPASLLVHKVLEDYCGVLESFSVRVKSDFEEFICQATPNSTCPRLKKLKLLRIPQQIESISEQMRCSSAVQMTIKTIVSRAPNLQELHLDRPVAGYEYLLEGSSAVLVVDREIDPFEVGIRDGLYGAIRLTRMRLGLDYCWRFSMESFNRIVPVVLQTSRTTLEELSVESVLAPNLMRYGIRLENLTKLTMRLNDQNLEVPADVSAFSRIFKDYDFTRIFPKLSKVAITSSGPSRREIRQFYDQGPVISQGPTLDRAVNIKQLKIKSAHSQPSVPFLASVFPHIETLAIENWNEPATPFGLIWENWVHLKQLNVHVGWLAGQNWDGSFCGLFAEEIAELRGKDDEYLKAVNIVPVMPSIMCMKELRSFTLTSYQYGSYNEENDPTFIFSKLTFLIAFSRCPNLSVSLRIKPFCENAWSHLKNYASIVRVE